MSGGQKQLFNVRVYGLFIKNGRILLSDERLMGRTFTKFPGGGLEFGEGTVECIIREMKEETGCDFNVISHFYTTDFYQVSAFNKDHQIISIYYLIDGPEIEAHLLGENPYEFKESEQIFRWVALKEISEEDVTFPIDKKVVRLLADFRG